MILAWLIFFFIFGAIIGSFLNVVVLRWGTGVSALKGRSFCFNCSRTLTARELIPLVSFLLQGGRCRNCRSVISLQYPLVEGLTGLLFAALAYKYLLLGSLGLSFVLACLGTGLLVAICIYDFKHKIIPDEFSLVLAGLGLAYTFVGLDWANLYSPTTLVALLAGPAAA